MSEYEAEKRERAYTEYRTSKFRPYPMKLSKKKVGEPMQGVIDQSNPSKDILDLVC